jgi:uncharacterized protein YaaN involved in tellurite resistance
MHTLGQILFSPDAEVSGGGGAPRSGPPVVKKPATSSGATSSATAEQTESQKEDSADEDVDGFQMPTLEKLVEGTSVAKGLKKRSKAEAYALANELKDKSSLDLMNVGLAEQEAATEVTKKFIDDVKITDLEKFADFATQGNKVMEQLNFGDLKPTWYQKLLGKKASKTVDAFINRQQTLSEVLEERNRAYSEEKMQLEEARRRAEAKKKDNEENYDKMSQKIGALEILYEAEKERVRQFKETHQDSSDPAVQRRMTEMDKKLALLSRHVNTQVAARTEINNQIATFQEQIDAIDVQVQLINDQQYFNQLVWNGTALMAIIDAKTRGSVEAIQYNRKLVEEMMKQRTEDVAETIKRILQEGEEGVANVEVFQVVTLKNIEMNAQRIKGYHNIREKMAMTKRMMEEMDEALKASKGLSAAQTDEDIEKVMDHLEAVREKIRLQREEVAGKKPAQADALVH